jgi:hypothetical protein
MGKVCANRALDEAQGFIEFLSIVRNASPATIDGYSRVYRWFFGEWPDCPGHPRDVTPAHTDQYGNPISGTVNWSTIMPTTNENAQPVPNSGSFSLSNGQGSFGLWTTEGGNWPVTLTVTDQYGHSLTKTIYINING